MSRNKNNRKGLPTLLYINGSSHVSHISDDRMSLSVIINKELLSYYENIFHVLKQGNSVSAKVDTPTLNKIEIVSYTVRECEQIKGVVEVIFLLMDKIRTSTK